MTATYKDNGGAVNGSNKVFTYDFPVLQIEDVQVALNGVTISQAKYTASLTPAQIEFVATTASDVQEASGAPKTGVTVRVYRKTIVGKADGNEDPKAVFAAGSSIRAGDLNLDVTQSLFGIHELQDRSILREDLIDDIIDGTKIADGAIADEHIQATAEIQVSKLKDGTARQVLQTAANGNDVEWTSNVDIPGTLDVTGASTLDGTLGVTGESTLASATVSDLTSGRIVFTSTGGALVDSANLTFDNTGNGHLKVGVNGAYGDITCSSITATTWNGFNNDTFWRTNKDGIDHYGRDGNGSTAIRIRKHDDHRLRNHNPSNPPYSNTFSIAKDITFEVGRYYNEGAARGLSNAIHFAPAFQVRHWIQQPHITHTSNDHPGLDATNYTYHDGGIDSGDSDHEFAQISFGDHYSTYLPTSNLRFGPWSYFTARRGGTDASNNVPNHASGTQPVFMLSGQKGAMFVHPDNQSHIYTWSRTESGLSLLASGAGGLGIRELGNNFGFGNHPGGTWTGSNTMYRDPEECMDLLEAACDVQIIVGGLRTKNKLEIGSSTVTGVLAISGTNVTATAAELNILDGVTATKDEINILDGVTATKDEINILDGVTATKDEINNLDGYTGNTTELNILDGVTATTAELNIVDGMTKATSLTSNSDTEFPTSKAVADHITTVIAPLGGLEVIATEAVFPNTQPDSGVVISISDAGGVAFNGSGVSTTATTVGGSTVTINGAPSSLYSETLVAGVGLMVSSTGSSQTYNYHKILGKEDDIKQLSDDINDFNARYRIASSAPSSSNHDGDLYYDTTLKKMKVYNAVTSQWDDVAQSSTSYIVTLSESFNGTLQDFTMSTAATDAQSTLVSINGVLQKPNAGTSTPSEGFAISGNTLKLAAAPPTNSTYFVVVLGDTVSIGTPSDNTVTSAKIVDGSIVNGDISSSAAIEGSKLDNPLHFADNHKVSFGNLGGTADLEIYHNSTGNLSTISNSHANGLAIRSNVITLQNASGDHDYLGTTNEAAVTLYYDNSPKLATSSSGISVTGSIASTDSINVSGGHINLADSVRVNCGGSDDLQIYHTSDTNYIVSDGGDLYIDTSAGHAFRVKTDQFNMKNAANNATLISADNGSSVKLFHNNEEKIITQSWGASIKDGSNTNTWLSLQTSAGNVAYVVGYSDLGTGSNETGIGLLNSSGGDKFLLATNDKGVELYYDGTAKFKTRSNGNELRGSIQYVEGLLRPWDSTGTDLGTDADRFQNLYLHGNIFCDDNDEVRLGDDGDLQLFHHSSTGESRIYNSNAGGLVLISDLIKLKNNANNETFLTATNGGAVAIYHDDSLKLQTWTNGVYFGTNGNAWTTSSGGLSVATSSDVTQLHFSRPSGFTGTQNVLYLNHNGTYIGGVNTSTTATSFPTSSDYRLKENVVDLSNAITRLKTLKPYRFNFKAEPSQTVDGFFAHEVTTVPEAVTGEKDGAEMQALDHSKLVPLLTAALQEAITKIETLETKVAALEAN